MLVSIRVLSLLLLLILLLHACSHQGGNLAAARSNYGETTKEKGLSGRKMVRDCLTSVCERASMVLSVTRKLRAKVDVKGQQTVRSLLPEEKDMSRFVAFNADYKGPRHHPPKNN